MDRRLFVLVLALAACAAGLVACGGDDGSDDDPQEVLRETFGAGKEVKSGRLDLSFRLDAQGLQNVNGPIALKLSGPFQSTGSSELPRFDFTATLDAGGQALRVGAVATGDDGYLRFQDQAYQLSDELFEQFKRGYAEQAKCNSEQESGVSFQTLGIDPGRWLRDPQNAGSEEVGGADTTHITAGVDVPRLLEDVNRILGRTDAAQADPCAEPSADQEGSGEGRQLSEEERGLIAESVREAKVDVWTGQEDRTLRRINVAISFEVPEEQRGDVGGLSSGDLAFDMTIGALNEDQDIQAPEDARPLEELTQALGGQVPGLGGGGTGGAGSGGGEGSGGGGAASEYERCVQESGGDVAKLQECADLIGQ